jgi:Uma2 family endonuclease
MTTVEQSQWEQRFLLQGIAWKTYEALREAPENYHVRMTYDQGDLEIMSPSHLHERYSYLIGRLIDVWTEELNIDIKSCRTMTFKREDLDRGLEPDNCYYVQNERRMRRTMKLDLAIDPPPDLAIEVEVSRPVIDKMPIYAAFGVPEVWRFNGEAFQFFALAAVGQYEPRDGSGCLPHFPVSQVVKVLSQLNTASETALVRSFRDWVKNNATRPGA